MESVSLLQTPIRCRKDIVRVLGQARQLAKFLRLPPLDQIEVGCQAFALAMEVAAGRKEGAIVFQLEEGSLLIGTISATEKCPKPYRIRKRLPEPVEMTREDFVWVIAHLQVLMKVDALEVIRQQNEEMTEIMQALQACRAELEKHRQQDVTTPAA